MTALQQAMTHWRVHAAGLAALVLLTAALMLLGVLPLQRQREQQQRVQIELQTQRSMADQLQASVRTLRRQLTQAQERLAQQPLSLKPIDELNHQLALLNELATASGLTVHEVQPAPAAATVGAAPWQAVAIRIAGTGGYDQFTGFLERLHEQMLDAAVIALSLSGDPATPDQAVQFQVELNWYTAPTARSDAHPGGGP